MFMRFRVCLVFLIVAFAASPAFPQVTPQDLIAGYRTNMAKFETLRVVWTREWANYDFETAQVSAKDSQPQRWQFEGLGMFKMQSGQPGSRRPSDAAGSYSPDQPYRRLKLVDYWTDRRRFQYRVPGRPVDPDVWSFSDEPLTTETLATTYKDYYITSYVPSSTPVFRTWQGVDDRGTRRGLLHGGTFSYLATSFSFPPLGSLWAAWEEGTDRVPKLHAIDRFFLLPRDGYRVVGEDVLDGHKVYEVEHLGVLKPYPKELTKYPGRLQTGRFTRAWVDVSRGCIPLRIEEESQFFFDGKPLRPGRGEPDRVVEVRAIESIANGGYFPTRGILREYGADPATIDASAFRIDDRIEGRIERGSVRSMLYGVESWETRRVEANVPMPESLFAFEFPKNTHYVDDVAKRTRVVGLTDEEVTRLLTSGVGPGRGSNLERRPGWFVPALATVAVIGVVLLVGVWYRRRRS